MRGPTLTRTSLCTLFTLMAVVAIAQADPACDSCDEQPTATQLAQQARGCGQGGCGGCGQGGAAGDCDQASARQPRQQRGRQWRGGRGQAQTVPTTQPATTQPASSQPATTQPATTQPAPHVDHPRGNQPAHAKTIHALLDNHLKIERTVTDLPNGIESITTSENELVAKLIQTHVHEMKARIDSGRPVRRWDPLFEEMFKQRDKMQLVIEDIEGGVKVRHTSEDPMMVKLIRQHAHQGVSRFVSEGYDRARQASPLPDDYRSPETQPDQP